MGPGRGGADTASPLWLRGPQSEREHADKIGQLALRNANGTVLGSEPVIPFMPLTGPIK